MSEKRFTDLEAEFKAFREQATARETELKAFKEKAEKQEAELKSASERIAAMQTEAQTKRFTDEVLGKNSANGTRWIGDVTKHVGYLGKLAKAFGEDSEEVKHYITTERAHAEQLMKSQLFGEIGSESFGEDGSAEIQFDAAVRRAMAEHKLTYDAAMERVEQESPELARRYATEMRGGR